MSKRAVMIGINYEGAPIDAPLNGCVNDVMVMKDTLINKFGFPEENISILIDSNNDGSYPKPTAEAITNAFNEAVDACQDGDVLFFHYSGHGSQQEDNSGEEADGKDEFLVTYDAQPITDDFLKGLLARVPASVKFTFVADCCHSGSMLDQPVQDIEITGEKSTAEGDQYDDSAAQGAASRSLNPEQLFSFIQNSYPSAADFIGANPRVANEVADGIGEDTGSRDWLSSAMNFVKEQAAAANAEAPVEINLEHCVLISGCEDNQTSADANIIPGQYNGALTFALVESLKNLEGAPTYREVVSMARDWLATNGYAQNPTLSCADGIADAPFICEPVA